MMGTCKECKYWDGEIYANDTGVCRLIHWKQGLDREYAILEHGTNDVLTKGNYGCVHFEEKPKGPFVVVEGWSMSVANPPMPYSIVYRDGGTTYLVGWRDAKESAERSVSILNELWAQRRI
jgi:hypothetical protein